VFRIEQAVIQTWNRTDVGRRVRGAPGVTCRIRRRRRACSMGWPRSPRWAYGSATDAAITGVALMSPWTSRRLRHRSLCTAVFHVDLATLGVDLPWTEAAGRLSDRLAAHLNP